MQWSAEMSDRIGDWLGLSNRSCLAEKAKGLKAMRQNNELPRICVGVDLHKMQFTVHAVNEKTGEVLLTGIYRTDSQGYKDFCKELHSIETEEECQIELAVEATGNARYFKNKMEAEGFVVLVVNTSKFKVITMSTRCYIWRRLILRENGQADEETGEKFILSWRFSSLTDCPNNRKTAAYQG